MSVNGSIVLYATFPPRKGNWLVRNFGKRSAPETLKSVPLREVALRLAQAFEGEGLLRSGATETARASGARLGEISQLKRFTPPTIASAQIQISAADTAAPLGELVFAATKGDLEPRLESSESGREIALPSIAITALAEPIVIEVDPPEAGDRRWLTQVAGWVFVEFFYENVRYSNDVHVVRNENHPIFDRLREILEAQVHWARFAY